MARDYMPYWGDPLHLPRDPQNARIGYDRFAPEDSTCTPFWRADVLQPENNQVAPLEQIGYCVHAHCWILVGRIIGLELVKADLKLFLIAVEQFWAKNTELWHRFLLKRVGFEPGSDRGPDRDPDDYTSETESEALSEYECDPEFKDRHKLPIWENPAIVPTIQDIIERAMQSHSESRLQRTPSSLVSHVPLDIAIEIVECSKLATIKDTRNLLAGFGWRLPDSYWKSRCKMDLIFEYADLHKTQRPVDWQFIGLATEELMEDPEWERNTGLGTRRWIFRQLKQIKTIFLDLLEQERLNPGGLIGPALRKYPSRKRLL